MIHGVLLMAAFIGLQAEQPTATEQSRDEVRRLVRQLDAPQLELRDAAEAALIERGPAALDLLPEKSDSAEAQQRLDRVREKLQRQASAAAAEASTVTLRAESVPLSEVLTAIERQTGNAFVDFRRRFGQPQTDPLLNVQFERTAFWSALDRVLDQAGMTVYPFVERRAVGVVAKAAGNQAARFSAGHYSGPFRFEAASITARRNLMENDDRSLTLTVEVAWEPRLRPIILVQPMSDIRAWDGSWRPLPVADPRARLEAAAGGPASLVKLDLSFVPPPEDVRRISSLKGKLLATLPGRIETFRFEDLAAARNVKKRIAAATVTLEQVRKTKRGNADNWEVRMRVRFDDAGDALESHRTWIFDNPAYLVGPGDRQIESAGYETISQSENEVGVAFFFPAADSLDRCTFIYKTPGSIITRGYDYELRGIPLP
ncbi:MAG: hypothetical protein JW959_12700 [Pirellulales bacterium]|nr:hypothetical protein [Pirellulales bacterium]